MAGSAPPWLVAMAEIIDRTPAPARVRATLANVAELHPDLPERLDDDHDLRHALLRVIGASRSLSRLLAHDPASLGVLGALDEPVLVTGEDAPSLAATKERELARIAARDLLGLDPLEAVGANLAVLARSVLATAWELSGSPPVAVIGMGKLGGDELNYSSDIDVMFVCDEGDANALARPAAALTDLARSCFRVDANLRPEGRNGPLVRTLGSYEVYWDRWAKPWEFQALLKARAAAGDETVGERFEASVAERLWAHPIGADDLRELRDMKARAEADAVRNNMAARELKRAPGGIRDIEFTAQLLQLVHAPLDPELRSPTTLTLLGELGSAGYVDPGDAAELADAYRFLREVEHRLQLVDDQQVHALPADAGELDELARVMGLTDIAEGSAASQLEQAVRKRRLAVRSIHERVYFRPLLEAFSGVDAALSPEAAVARLTAFGFTDAKRTQAAVRELTQGLNRTSRLMQQMLPLLLDWLSAAPDPELGLVMLRNLLSGRQRAPVLVEAFREAPDAARQLCKLVGTSRLVGDIVQHNPDLVERLGDPDKLLTKPRNELVQSALSSVSWRGDADDRQPALRRWKDRHLLGIAARDLLGYTGDVDQIGTDLTALAEATLEVALRSLDPQVRFAVIAMGRFGGGDLSYSSDLDVMFVHDGAGADAVTEAHRAATQLRRFLHGSTPANRLYEMDTDLRPEGKGGPLSRSVDGFVAYWERHAATWERQAMLRARPVAGDLDLGAQLLEKLDPLVMGDGTDTEAEREIRRLKARMERERIPPGEDPQFHLKLGRGSLSDVEWTVQLLQLRHGVRATGTWQAMAALEKDGWLSSEDADMLGAAYRFCERTRNRLFLVRSGPGDALPTQTDQALWLARSLRTSPGELREEYRRVTRRARWVTERLFFGQE